MKRFKMKKQIIQSLWRIANGQPQQQGEKVVYPNIREQLNAIKTLMSIEGWDELDPQEQMSAPGASSCAPTTSHKETTSHEQTITIKEEKTSEPQEPMEKAPSREHDAVVIVAQEQPLPQQPSTKCIPKKMSVGKMRRILRRGKLAN